MEITCGFDDSGMGLSVILGVSQGSDDDDGGAAHGVLLWLLGDVPTVALGPICVRRIVACRTMG